MEANFKLKTHYSVLIVDEHILFREGLLLMFRIYEQVIVVATEHHEAQIAVRQHKPDLVIMGLGGKHSPCWPTVQMLCKQFPDLSLLILDDIVRTRNIHTALELGIRGYWTKHATFNQITQASSCLLAGQRSFCPEVDRYLFKTRHGLRYHPAHTVNPMQRLTPREIELLTLLAQGLTLKQCSQQMKISVNTVDNHKTRLMRKLGVHKAVELARLAVHEGLVAEE
jgi:DNA-binding NarL/FixJ family response regulator